MAKRKKKVEFPFYEYLHLFVKSESRTIRKSYTTLSRKFLAFNDPKSGGWLRLPQYEALEIYIFLKEFCDNQKLHDIFSDWFYKRGKFENRTVTGVTRKGEFVLFEPLESENQEDLEAFNDLYGYIARCQELYPNYIFALTMGLGKTILVATCIFYEFLLANKYPKDSRFCHNALVFGPDKTVLQSLREIQTFNKSKVVPSQYVAWLDANLKFHFLDPTGISLNTIDNSRFNIIISNTQKVILKKDHKSDTSKVGNLLFQDVAKYYEADKVNKEYASVTGIKIDSDTDLVLNQRFEKLKRLPHLGIYVDEAHHVFGTKLDKEFNPSNKSSLRKTIDELAKNLEISGSKVVACYNYTGTPYAKKSLLPEVVYSYGLRDAIDRSYLKSVRVIGYSNIKEQTYGFISEVVKEFWKDYNGKLYEGMRPKLAIFCSSVPELQSEVKPVLEQVLSELNIPIEKILVNVGNPKITSNDDLREFRLLDTIGSNKQFILLVNKGKEGWNCRSLFGVAMHRTPKSKVFVLQATMRCLRAIGEVQHKAKVWLSEDNKNILAKELEQNFRISLEEFSTLGSDKELYDIHLNPPPVIVTLKKQRQLHELIDIKPKPLDFNVDNLDINTYDIKRSESDIKNMDSPLAADLAVQYIKKSRIYSWYTLTAEISRYLNIRPLKIKKLIEESDIDHEQLLSKINTHNEIVHDILIPKLFKSFFKIDAYSKTEEIEINLVKEQKPIPYKRKSTSTTKATDPLFQFRSKPELTVRDSDAEVLEYKEKSFHIDTYCFDSKPERNYFMAKLKSDEVDKIYFTGMLTQGQSEFLVQYIDPLTHSLRSYYPDFYIITTSGQKLIIEVKGDHQIEDAVVQAKSQYATGLADLNDMEYHIVKSSEYD